VYCSEKKICRKFAEKWPKNGRFCAFFGAKNDENMHFFEGSAVKIMRKIRIGRWGFFFFWLWFWGFFCVLRLVFGIFEWVFLCGFNRKLMGFYGGLLCFFWWLF
jgi:hypothetical protein